MPKIKPLWAAACIFIFLLSACLSTPTTAPQVTPPAPAATDTPDPARYTNQEGQFSLRLPEGWQVLEPLTIDSDPARPYHLYVLGREPSAEGGPGSSKIIIADAQQWTPEQYALSQCSTCPANPFETLTLGGKPAQKTQVGGGGVPFVITWYFVEHNGKLIGLAIHDSDSLEPLQDVVESLQFEQTSP